MYLLCLTHSLIQSKTYVNNIHVVSFIGVSFTEVSTFLFESQLEVRSSYKINVFGPSKYFGKGDGVTFRKMSSIRIKRLSCDPFQSVKFKVVNVLDFVDYPCLYKFPFLFGD